MLKVFGNELLSIVLIYKYSDNGLFKKKSIKKQTRGGLKTYLFENPPEIFKLFILPLEILNQTKLHS